MDPVQLEVMSKISSIPVIHLILRLKAAIASIGLQASDKEIDDLIKEVNLKIRETIKFDLISG